KRMSISRATLEAQATCPVIASLILSLDSYWPDDTSLVAAVAGVANTRSSDVVTRKRAIAALDWVIRTHRPIWLNEASLGSDASALGALPAIVDVTTFRNAKAAYATALKHATAAWATAKNANRTGAATARALLDGLRDDRVGAWRATGARAAWAFVSSVSTWDAWEVFDAWDVAGQMDYAVMSLVSLNGTTSTEHPQTGLAGIDVVAGEVRTQEL